VIEDLVESDEELEVAEVDRTQANIIISRRHQDANADAGYESARKKIKR
jgi:hypothetical protein